MCQNCGKNEVTFRYTQVINGVKKEMNLCDKCARELGLKDINFNMPISFSNFLGDFFSDYTDNLLPSFMSTQALKCKTCGTTFDDFINSGEFGCNNCYDVFEDRIFPILKSLQGANRHIGRGYKKVNNLVEKNIENNKSQDTKTENRLEKLHRDLQEAIKDERYEDAAKIRDQIKKEQENGNNANQKDENKKDKKE